MSTLTHLNWQPVILLKVVRLPFSDLGGLSLKRAYLAQEEGRLLYADWTLEAAERAEPFVSATVETLKQMAGMVCERTGLRLAPDATSTGFYSGTIGLSGKAEGFVSVTFSKDLATNIVCKMLSMTVEEVTEEDIRDGVGEFMNVVAGAAKAELVNTKHAFSLSIPQVFSGGPHTAAQPRGIPVFVIEFKADGARFDVLVCLRQTHS